MSSFLKSQILPYVNHVMRTPARAVSRADSREQGGVNVNNGTILNDAEFTGMESIGTSIRDVIVEEVRRPSAVVDLTGRSFGEDSNRADTGTSIPVSNPPQKLLHVHTKEIDYHEDPLASLDRVSSLGDPLPSSIRNSSLGLVQDLLSARTSESGPSLSWPDTNVGSSKEFGVYVMPSNQEEFDKICKKQIGNGTNMCIKKGCKVNHRGGDLALVDLGEIFVRRSVDSVFLLPRTDSVNVSTEILDHWLTSRKNIEEWSTVFAVANLTDYNKVLNTAQLDQGAKFAEDAHSHKSPGLLKLSRYEQSTNTFARLFASLGTPRLMRENFTFQTKKTEC